MLLIPAPPALAIERGALDPPSNKRTAQLPESFRVIPSTTKESYK
jgi:hypothetical protein